MIAAAASARLPALCLMRVDLFVFREEEVEEAEVEEEEEAEVIGGGTTGVSPSEPLVTPEVGAVLTPGPLSAGVPLPRLRLVVQPNAAMDAASETASNELDVRRLCKFLFS